MPQLLNMTFGICILSAFLNSFLIAVSVVFPQKSAVFSAFWLARVMQIARGMLGTPLP